MIEHIRKFMKEKWGPQFVDAVFKHPDFQKEFKEALQSNDWGVFFSKTFLTIIYATCDMTLKEVEAYNKQIEDALKESKEHTKQ